MQEDEDFLMRPVMRGLISYTDLHGNTLTLEDFLRMNEAIAVEGENNARAALARRREAERK